MSGASGAFETTLTGRTNKTAKVVELESSDGLTTAAHMSAHAPHLRGIGSDAGSSDPQPVSASPQQGDSAVALAVVSADS